MANCCKNNSLSRAQNIVRNGGGVGCCCQGDVTRILPTSSMAVAELLNTATQTITAVNTPINFSNTQAFKNSTVTSTGMTVNNGGTYLLNYGINASSTAGSAVSIYVNGVEVPTTRISLTAAGSTDGSVILTLNSGDVISLRASAISTNIVLPADSLNAYVTLVPVYNQ